MNLTSNVVQFELPKHLACPKPSELRYKDRDEVRLMVTNASGQASHVEFKELDRYLNKGDALVVNTSAVRPSAIPIPLPGGRKGVVHFSTPINNHRWLVEIREIIGDATHRYNEGVEGTSIELPGGAEIQLVRKYFQHRELINLWVAVFHWDEGLDAYLTEFAQPIKYEKVYDLYPLDFYQSVFSFHTGSAEMPSAARGFTDDLVQRLLEKGISIIPLLLHTGVSSLEENEKPYPEYMEIDPVSAHLINRTRRQGGTVVAVGTTVVRALETVANEMGEIIPFSGSTDLYIDDQHKMKAVDGLVTGFHEPKASHLNMLQSLAGFDHIKWAYELAIRENYYWHQFGDLHLILP